MSTECSNRVTRMIFEKWIEDNFDKTLLYGRQTKVKHGKRLLMSIKNVGRLGPTVTTTSEICKKVHNLIVDDERLKVLEIVRIVGVLSE